MSPFFLLLMLCFMIFILYHDYVIYSSQVRMSMSNSLKDNLISTEKIYLYCKICFYFCFSLFFFILSFYLLLFHVILQQKQLRNKIRLLVFPVQSFFSLLFYSSPLLFFCLHTFSLHLFRFYSAEHLLFIYIFIYIFLSYCIRIKEKNSCKKPNEKFF